MGWTSGRPISSRRPMKQRIVGSAASWGLSVVLAVAPIALGACASTTLFQSAFNDQQTHIYSPPNPTQLVGTMQVIAGDSGAILVEPTQVHGSSDNWLRISRELSAPNTNNGTP